MIEETFFAEPINRDLRGKARALYRAHFADFVLAVLVVFVLKSLLPSLFSSEEGGSSLWNWAIYPIVTIGLYRMALFAVWGEKPAPSHLFDSCRSFRSYFLAVFTGVLSNIVIMVAAMLTVFSVGLLPVAALAVGGSFFIGICLLILIVFFGVRFSLLPFLLATHRGDNPLTGIQLSWQKSRGHFFKIVWFFASLLVLPTLAVSLLSSFSGVLFGPIAEWVVQALLTSLLIPYFTLAEVQFFGCFFTPTTQPGGFFNPLEAQASAAPTEDAFAQSEPDAVHSPAPAADPENLRPDHIP